MKYLLDANTYIQAKNFYYGMDICPAYWDWLEQQYQLGVLASIEMIGQELKAGDDELAEWAKQHAEHFISHDDAATQRVLAEITQAVMNTDYNPGNRDHFLAKGDPWLIAKAKTTDATVVTHEVLAGPDAKKVKVPNICRQFDVPYINTFELLRKLQTKFHLST